MTKKTKSVIKPATKESLAAYVEGQDGFVTIHYLGTIQLSVMGCKTKNRYMFDSGSVRLIDANDAKCIFDLLPGQFEEVVVKATPKTKTVKPVQAVIEDVGDGIQGSFSES